jgi:hypothetical protein
MDAPANEWRRELLRILRSLERDGLIVSWMGADGQIRWRATGKIFDSAPSVELEEDLLKDPLH